MTRLVSEWIAELEEGAAGWNDELKNRVGMDYLDLAAAVSGKTREEMEDAAAAYRVAVIPITSGLGTIGSFAESVAAIVRAMGFDVFVTENTDVNGIYEAGVKNADIIYMADDDRYIAMNRNTGAMGDNNIATAGGYAEVLLALAGLSGGAAGVSTAVLGYGMIGRLMAAYLADKGAAVSVYDKDPGKRQEVLNHGYVWIETAEQLKEYRYIADATSEGGWLTAHLLHEEAVVAAPGIPFSLTEDACRKYKGKYIHDLLEIGTACMMGGAI